MVDIICSRCDHPHFDIESNDAICNNCGEQLITSDLGISDIKTEKNKSFDLYIEVVSRHCLFTNDNNATSFITFSLDQQIKDKYKKVDCQFTSVMQNFCKTKSLDLSQNTIQLCFTAIKSGLFSLKIELECYAEDNSIDKYIATKDDFFVNRIGDGGATNFNINEMTKIEGSIKFEGYNPNKIENKTEKIFLKKVFSIPHTPFLSALLLFKTGSIHQRYWISAKDSVVFGRPNSKNMNTTDSNKAAFPLNLFENTPMQNRISAEHFKISIENDRFILENLSNQGTHVNELLSSLDNPKDAKLPLSINDKIKMCNATKLELIVDRIDNNSSIFIKYLSDSSEKRAFIIFSEKLDLTPYLEKGSPKVELIHKNKYFYTRYKNSEKPLVVGEYVKFDNVEFCIESFN